MINWHSDHATYEELTGDPRPQLGRLPRHSPQPRLKVREADLPSDETTTGHKIVTGLQEAIAHAKGETGPSEPAPAEAA